jgi:hypothetical protein
LTIKYGDGSRDLGRANPDLFEQLDYQAALSVAYDETKDEEWERDR